MTPSNQKGYNTNELREPYEERERFTTREYASLLQQTRSPSKVFRKSAFAETTFFHLWVSFSSYFHSLRSSISVMVNLRLSELVISTASR